MYEVGMGGDSFLRNIAGVVGGGSKLPIQGSGLLSGSNLPSGGHSAIMGFHLAQVAENAAAEAEAEAAEAVAAARRQEQQERAERRAAAAAARPAYEAAAEQQAIEQRQARRAAAVTLGVGAGGLVVVGILGYFGYRWWKGRGDGEEEEG